MTVPCSFDSTLPPQPILPSAGNVCATLMATQAVTGGGVPAETLDTSRITAALSSCGSGKAVKLVASGANNAFVVGPFTLPAGVTLWVDAGVTMYGTRNASAWGGTTPLITVSGAGSGIVGDGVIDGQGGEPPTGGGMSPWEQSIAASPGSASVPPMIQTTSASTNFTMYRITLHNSPKFHVRLAGSGHLIWGVTLLTPSKATNSAGTALTPHNARNTDGIDPGAGGSISNAHILYSKISVGDDQIAIKAGSNHASNLTIGHNHFGSGHGMSIGSETNGGVDTVNVCDLTIDNSLRATGSPAGDINGIRIKSDPTRGGIVNNVSYTEVCARDLNNPIIFNPMYSGSSGSLIPTYSAITVKNFHAMTTSVSQVVTLDGFDSSHLTDLTLDNVTVTGTSSVTAQDATVTLGPGTVSFASAITGAGVTVKNNVAGAAIPVDCGTRWASIP